MTFYAELASTLVCPQSLLTLTGEIAFVNREALLVLGMHRSGTSAVAGLLIRLGAQPPQTLMPADAANSEGYWESAAFYDFHERLLRSAGSRWDAYTRLEPQWFESDVAAGLARECRDLLHAEFGEAARFVLKDPRICRFLPFWMRVFQKDSITPAAVLVYRHPTEVARSIKARNGFEPERSLLIWLRHVLDAEFETRAVGRVFVRYHDVLEDWKAVARRMSRELGGIWPAPSNSDEVEIERFVNPRLRHHNSAGPDLDVPEGLADWVRRAWNALERLHGQESRQNGEALASLDALRHEFDRVTAIFGGLAEARPEFLERIGTLESQVTGLMSRATLLESTRQDLDRQVQALEQRAGLLGHELAAARHDAKAVRDSVSWKITGPLRAAGRIFK